MGIIVKGHSVLTEVTTHANIKPITVQATNFQGERLNFRIETGDARVDDRGVIRVCSAKYDDGYVATYKLLPKKSTARDITKYVLEFLGGYAISRANGKLIKGETEVAHLSRFTAGSAGTHTVSYIERLFPPEDLGYFNVVNDKLIFADRSWNAPKGTW